METHPFFAALGVVELDPKSLVTAIEKTDGLLVIFFWGHNCPNCDVAKNAFINHLPETRSLKLKWTSVNVYEHSELGTKYGLHGVPTFLFFLGGKRLGRISPFPGMAPFLEAVQKLRSQNSLN